MKIRTAVFVAALALALAACGGSDDAAPTSAAQDDPPADNSGAALDVDDALVDTADAVDDLIDNATDFADDIADDLEEAQAAAGGGSATLTVGDQSWTFGSVLCAFGPDEIGQEGAEFVMSSIQDGKQMYLSIDSFGHSASLNDIKDFENPSVSLSSTFGGPDFIALDGKSFNGNADFLDDTSDSFETVPGTISGTCP